jgi:hypothetical protein
VRLEVLGKLKKCIHLIKIRIRDFPACSIVSQPLRYCMILTHNLIMLYNNVKRKVSGIKRAMTFPIIIYIYIYIYKFCVNIRDKLTASVV